MTALVLLLAWFLGVPFLASPWIAGALAGAVAIRFATMTYDGPPAGRWIAAGFAVVAVAALHVFAVSTLEDPRR